MGGDDDDDDDGYIESNDIVLNENDDRNSFSVDYQIASQEIAIEQQPELIAEQMMQLNQSPNPKDDSKSSSFSVPSFTQLMSAIPWPWSQPSSPSPSPSPFPPSASLQHHHPSPPSPTSTDPYSAYAIPETIEAQLPHNVVRWGLQTHAMPQMPPAPHPQPPPQMMAVRQEPYNSYHPHHRSSSSNRPTAMQMPATVQLPATMQMPMIRQEPALGPIQSQMPEVRQARKSDSGSKQATPPSYHLSNIANVRQEPRYAAQPVALPQHPRMQQSSPFNFPRIIQGIPLRQSQAQSQPQPQPQQQSQQPQPQLPPLQLQSQSKLQDQLKTSSNRDWNAELQTLLDRWQSTWDVQALSSEELVNIATKIDELVKAFTKEAQKIGKVILTESGLPDASKTIKPVSIGGIAGGEKFIKNNILFKLARDWKRKCLRYLYITKLVKPDNKF